MYSVSCESSSWALLKRSSNVEWRTHVLFWKYCFVGLSSSNSSPSNAWELQSPWGYRTFKAWPIGFIAEGLEGGENQKYCVSKWIDKQGKTQATFTTHSKVLTVFSTKSFSKDFQPGESHRHGRIPQGMAKWTSMEVLWTKTCINVLFANSCVADPRGRRLKSHVVEWAQRNSQHASQICEGGLNHNSWGWRRRDIVRKTIPS